jgi:hypothetical protein
MAIPSGRHSGVIRVSPVECNNMWAAIINVLIGIWVMIAPGMFGFDTIPANNHYIVGPLVFTMATASIWGVNRAFRYFNLLAGIWLAISPVFLSYETPAEIMNTCLSGALITIFSLVKGKIRHQYGGGWSILFRGDRFSSTPKN